MRTRHRRPTRTRYFVLAFAVVGVLGAGGIASAQTIGHHTHPSARHAARLGSATNVADASRYRRPHPTRPTATATPTAVPTSPSPSPTTAAPTTAAPTSAVPTTQPTTAPPPPATTPPTTAPSGDPVIQQVLDHINAARAANGLAAYALSAALSKASEAHNALMVGGCGLSHQCPGEASLGDRFTAAGVPWTSAGENIGQGNASDNQASIIAAANGLTDLMLAEVAPDDGHKKNLLNTGFKHIGLAVTRGSDGRVWLTQDFVN